MVVQLRPVTSHPSTALGRMQAYLGQCGIDEVRRYRDLFGGVTLQNMGGLKMARRLKLAGELAGVDLDPATYLHAQKPSDQFGLDLDLPPFDWVAAQCDLELPIIRTAGHRIKAGRHDELRAVLDADYPVSVSVVLVLDGDWLSEQHSDALLTIVNEADRDISLVLAAIFDPLDSGQKVDALWRLLAWSTHSGRQLELLRTDLIGLPAVIDGAHLASMGLTTSTRHFGLPLPVRKRKEYEDRQLSPLIFVPRLLHWHRGAVLHGLRPWGGAGVTDCDCPACGSAGVDLLRFAKTYPNSVPQDVTTAIREHDAYALSNLAQSILATPDPRAALLHQRTIARNMARSVKANQKVQLDEPSWVTTWI